jgi:multidrug transporter EmrE-like cation transporter
VAAALGIVVFHEGVSMLKLTGIVLVLASVAVMSRQNEKE